MFKMKTVPALHRAKCTSRGELLHHFGKIILAFYHQVLYETRQSIPSEKPASLLTITPLQSSQPSPSQPSQPSPSSQYYSLPEASPHSHIHKGRGPPVSTPPQAPYHTAANQRCISNMFNIVSSSMLFQSFEVTVHLVQLLRHAVFKAYVRGHTYVYLYVYTVYIQICIHNICIYIQICSCIMHTSYLCTTNSGIVHLDRVPKYILQMYLDPDPHCIGTQGCLLKKSYS